MQEFKGTPGSWYVDDDHPARACLDIKSESHGEVYASVYLITDKSEYDAHLIAAAPDLLEALQNMVEAYQHEASIDNPALLEARAAIAKALGKQYPTPFHIWQPIGAG